MSPDRERPAPPLEAYMDTAFLRSPTARTLRVLAELLEPQYRLEREGIEAIPLAGANEAFELAVREPPDLVLLDLQLPDLHGIELLKRLRTSGEPRLEQLPIVVLTGTAPSEALLVATFGAGANDYLTKPVKPTLIRSRVRSWLLRSAHP